MAGPDGLDLYFGDQLVGTVRDGVSIAFEYSDLAACADLIRAYSTQPAVDLRNFMAWIFFNSAPLPEVCRDDLANKIPAAVQHQWTRSCHHCRTPLKISPCACGSS